MKESAKEATVFSQENLRLAKRGEEDAEAEQDEAEPRRSRTKTEDMRSYLCRIAIISM